MQQDHGLEVSWTVLRRQIGALPCRLYEVRLIHSGSRRPYPGLRRWTATHLLKPATVRFLRFCNREGYDVYFRPYAGAENAGYILLDFDHPAPGIVALLQSQGHAPSVVVESSPGHWQAWIRVSTEPLPPALATCLSRQLAQIYAADPASVDWRHVGRLAGFTNRKPQRRQPDGLAPWVRLIYARGCLARGGAALLESAAAAVFTSAKMAPFQRLAWDSLPTTGLDAIARQTYQDCLHRLRILERYPCPDWSIADRWVARELLRSGQSPSAVAAVLCPGSPGFPRGHGDPEDYLRRTLDCAAR